MCCRANHVRLLIYPVTDNCLTFLTLVKKYVVGWRYAGSGHGTRPCTATPSTHGLSSGTRPFRSSVDQIGANIACQQIAWVYRGPVVARTAPRAYSLAVALPSSVAAVPTPVLKGRRHVHVLRIHQVLPDSRLGTVVAWHSPWKKRAAGAQKQQARHNCNQGNCG